MSEINSIIDEIMKDLSKKTNLPTEPLPFEPTHSFKSLNYKNLPRPLIAKTRMGKIISINYDASIELDDEQHIIIAEFLHRYFIQNQSSIPIINNVKHFKNMYITYSHHYDHYTIDEKNGIFGDITRKSILSLCKYITKKVEMPNFRKE